MICPNIGKNQKNIRLLGSFVSLGILFCLQSLESGRWIIFPLWLIFWLCVFQYWNSICVVFALRKKTYFDQVEELTDSSQIDYVRKKSLKMIGWTIIFSLISFKLFN